MRQLLCSIILLAAAHGFTSAQSFVYNFNDNAPEALKERLEASEDYCRLQGGNWMNAPYGFSDSRLQQKFSIVHFASFDNVHSMHNMHVLAGLQSAHPEMAIVLVNDTKYNFPSEAEHIERLMTLHDNQLPVYMVETEKISECNRGAAGHTTLFISPEGKVFDSTGGPLELNKLKVQVPKLVKAFKKGGNYDSQPFTGFKPSQSGKTAIMQFPIAIAKDEYEQNLFVSDYTGNRIWVLSISGDVLYIIGNGMRGNADGSMEAASFDRPWGLAYDGDQKVLYVADHGNHLIRKVDFKTQEVSTFLGSGRYGAPDYAKGVGTTADIGFPMQLAFKGFELYVSSGMYGDIWRCDVRTEVLERIAGTGIMGFNDGDVSVAKLSQPSGMAFGPAGQLYFSDSQSSSIRLLENGEVTTLVGEGMDDFGYSDDRRKGILFQNPMGICMVDDEVYIADAYNHDIRRLNPLRKKTETVAGSAKPGHYNGRAVTSMFYMPTDLVVMVGKLFITDAGNNLIKTFDLATGTVNSLPFFNYTQLGQAAAAPVTDLRDYDRTISLKTGNNVFKLSLDLGEYYEIDPSGFSNVAISSRNDTLFVRENAINDGYMTFDYQLEEDVRPRPIVLDFNLFFKEKERPEMQYYRSFSYIISVKKDEKAEAIEELIFKIDLDGRSGGPIIPEGQKFMD